MAATPKVLIVDDDSDTRSMVRTILEANGFEVHEASGGRDALDQLNSLIPNVILLDIMMPEMNGYDVVVHLKQKVGTQNIPIIMVSAKGDPDDLILGYKDYGVEYYITKPFTTRQLLAGIKLVIE